MKILFNSGQIVATRGALNLIVTLEVDITLYLNRHFSGIWGDLCADDWEANNWAVDNDSRIFSSYNLGKTKLWIITEWDRSATTILLPDDY